MRVQRREDLVVQFLKLRKAQNLDLFEQRPSAPEIAQRVLEALLHQTV